MSKHTLGPSSGRHSVRVTNEVAAGRIPPRHATKSADDSFDGIRVSKTSQYVTAGRLQSLRLTLSERDESVIRTLALVRVATSIQLEQLLYTDVTRRRARASLASLVNRRVLARLPRIVGGVRAGSAGYVYVLDAAGQRLAGVERGGRVVRPWTLGRLFLTHSLAVTELYVRLATARNSEGIRLARFSGEPACWHRFLGPAGAAMVLKPDAHLVLEVDGYEDVWFVEIDLGTESLPTVTGRCASYRRYWQSGVEQERTGVFPKVLWLVPDAQRLAALVAVVSRQPSEAQQLFAVALFDDAVARLGQGAGS